MLKNLARLVGTTWAIGAWAAPCEPMLLVDGNAALQIDPCSPRGAYSWNVDGIEQLKQQWFWYRLGSSGPERSLDTLPFRGATRQDGNRLTLVYETNTFRIQVEYVLSGSAPGSGISRVVLNELLTVENIGPVPLVVTVFWYSDLDLAGRATEDTVSGAANFIHQSSPWSNPGRQSVAGRTPAAWEVGLVPATLAKLSDAAPSSLDANAGPVGPGDVAAAFEWRATLAVTGQASVVQFPITTILNAPCQNQPPTLDPITNRVIWGNAGEQIVPLTGLSSGSLLETQLLSLTAWSDNPALIADPTVLYTQFESTGELRFAPLLNTNGQARLTVVVDDHGCTNNTVTRSFLVTVRQFNLPPQVEIISPTNGAIFLAPATFSVVAEAEDPDGVVTNVQFFVGSARLGQRTQPPYFVVWSNVPTGSFVLTAQATDNLGLSATSAPVQVHVLARPPVEWVGPLILNRQTGLFEQRVRVLNPSSQTVQGIRLLLGQPLPQGVQWWNATDLEFGWPYAQHNAPVNPGDSVEFLLEFYLPDRLLVHSLTNQTGTFNPGYYAQVVPPTEPQEPAGTVLSPGPLRYALTNGNFLIEFSTQAGRLYYIQYTDELAGPEPVWRTARPPVSGNGTRLQWIDAGPPKTHSRPATVPQRFYRVVLVP